MHKRGLSFVLLGFFDMLVPHSIFTPIKVFSHTNLYLSTTVTVLFEAGTCSAGIYQCAVPIPPFTENMHEITLTSLGNTLYNVF